MITPGATSVLVSYTSAMSLDSPTIAYPALGLVKATVPSSTSCVPSNTVPPTAAAETDGAYGAASTSAADGTDSDAIGGFSTGAGATDAGAVGRLAAGSGAARAASAGA